MAQPGLVGVRRSARRAGNKSVGIHHVYKAAGRPQTSALAISKALSLAMAPHASIRPLVGRPAPQDSARFVPSYQVLPAHSRRSMRVHAALQLGAPYSAPNGAHRRRRYDVGSSGTSRRAGLQVSLGNTAAAIVPIAAAEGFGLETDGSTLLASGAANGHGRVKTQEMHCHAEGSSMV